MVNSTLAGGNLQYRLQAGSIYPFLFLSHLCLCELIVNPFVWRLASYLSCKFSILTYVNVYI